MVFLAPPPPEIAYIVISLHLYFCSFDGMSAMWGSTCCASFLSALDSFSRAACGKQNGGSGVCRGGGVGMSKDVQGMLRERHTIRNTCFSPPVSLQTPRLLHPCPPIHTHLSCRFELCLTALRSPQHPLKLGMLVG